MQNTFRVRGERLKRLVESFLEVFDAEFPEISTQVKSVILEDWKRFDYNKELANANIQMVNFLTNLGNNQALIGWNEIYDEFRRMEGV